MGYEYVMFFFLCGCLDVFGGCLFFVDGCGYEVVFGQLFDFVGDFFVWCCFVVVCVGLGVGYGWFVFFGVGVLGFVFVVWFVGYGYDWLFCVCFVQFVVVYCLYYLFCCVVVDCCVVGVVVG